MARKIPIFITTFDRLDVLVRSCKTYRKLATDVEIIIHDQGSTYKPMVEYLEILKDHGYSVYYGANEPTSVRDSIKDWFSKNDATHYVVTDPDIAFEGSSPNSLNVYIDLLALEKDVTCVGPALRTTDIPCHYPMKQQVINWEKQWYKEEDHRALRINNEIINYHFSVIDTTFAVYKKGHEFVKPNTKAIRVSMPHDARHLDWYMDHNNLTEDYKYYIGSAKKAGKSRTHWSSLETAHK